MRDRLAPASEPEATSWDRFPVRLLTLALVISLAAFAWTFLRLYLAADTFRTASRKDQRIEALNGRIIHLDELLTMSARMAAATGAPTWEARYRDYAPQLDAAIAEGFVLAAGTGFHPRASALFDANQALVDIENRAFAHMHRGELGRAQATLDSPAYQSLKHAYAAAANALNSGLADHMQTVLAREGQRTFTTFASSAFGLLLAVISWVLVVRRIQDWRQQLRHHTAAREEAQAHLDRLRHRNEQILTGAAEGIYGLDRNGCLTFINPAAEAMLNCPAGDMLGKSMHAILHHSHPDGSPYPVEDCPIYAALHDSQTHRVSGEVFWRADGSRFPVEYCSSPIVEDGRVVGAVVTFRDVSDRLNAELLQRERLEALSRTEALKDQFLGIVWHELRAPVAVQLSSASILLHSKTDTLSPTQRRHFDKILASADTMMALVDDLLDATQLQSGKFRLQARPIALSPVIDAALENLEHAATTQNQTLQTDVPESLPLVQGDQRRLIQVLTNLVQNAIRHSPPDSTIRIVVEHQGDQLACRVSDQGPGITPQLQPHLFERFAKGPAVQDGSGHNLGLGLFIARGLIEAHGGRIGVDSQEGAGSCFWFTLPVVDPFATVTDS